MGNLVAYYRVSTQKQGSSGLGLEAQRAAVAGFINGDKLVGEFTEVESGKRDDNRPELAKAFAACRVYGAKLIVAKLDRLSRDAHFLLGLQKAGVPFIAADMPEANEMVVGIMAVVAQAERKMISTRTKAALAAAKARGKRLGNPRLQPGTAESARAASRANVERARARHDELRPVIAELQASGYGTLLAIAEVLNGRGVATPSGFGRWTATTVSRVVKLSGQN